MAWTVIDTAPAKGGVASVAIVDDKLVTEYIYNWLLKHKQQLYVSLKNSSL